MVFSIPIVLISTMKKGSGECMLKGKKELERVRGGWGRFIS